MSADAMARLREHLEHCKEFQTKSVRVTAVDLRVVLDRAALLDEALDALSPFAHRECDDSEAGYVCACEQCRAYRLLAKAGRRDE